MLHDLRTSWRSLLRTPLFTLTAAGSLALGIGACTIIFSVVYGLLLRPLPYPRPSELVHIGMGNPTLPGGAFGFLSSDTFKNLRGAKDSGLSALGGFGYGYANLTGVPTPAQLTVGLVTVDYFRVYGVPAQLGRTFVDADCHVSSPSAVVLTDRLWRKQFNAAANILGQPITLDNKSRTVVGVMPAAFKDLNDGCDCWQPLAEDGPEMASTATRRYLTTARLADASEVSRNHLRAVLGNLSANLAQTDLVNHKGWYLEFHPLGGGILIGPGAEQALWLLLGAVGCVLLVTCTNVANLQLVRAAAQLRDILRLVVGQGARLIAAGLVIGLLVSCGLSHLLTSLLYGVQASDPATLAAVVVLLGAAALVASYLPARRAMRVDPLTALREE